MRKMGKYNIILTDDHVVLRDALASLINSFDECNVMSLAGNGKELMQCIENGKMPHIVLLDLNMPLMDGYETARWLYQKHPYIKILVLTMYDSEIALIRLLQLGVRGFLKKDIHPSELRRALISVAEDGYYYSHNTTGKLGSLFQKSNGRSSSIEKAMLNDVEIAFLKLASTELTYKEIAHKMRMTPRAIDGFRDNLFEKLDVKSRVAMAIYSIKNGIVDF
jgi:two-component system, NarL family, invasion response regulator UvrY